MIVGIKDASKLTGVSIVLFCAVFVCTMFFNYSFDLADVKAFVTTPEALIFYNAQQSTARVVNSVSGGCLLITSVIMLFFYIKHYIDTHSKELGILKALGYCNLKIAGGFYIFGASAFIGSSAGFSAAFAIMPMFYKIQNKEHILPNISVGFHPLLILYMIIIPTIAFGAVSVIYANLKLKRPALSLLKECPAELHSRKKSKSRHAKNRLFIDEIRYITLSGKKSLTFFIVFSAFCFSSMTQMSFSMKKFSSIMMGAIIMLIGVILAFTTLIMAISTVVNGNRKTIAIMRVYGYTQKQCCSALLGGYRPLSYAGFAAGTVYQYLLLKIMITVVFSNVEGVPEYNFNFTAMLVSLIIFIAGYEAIMHFCSEKIKNVSVKEIMLD